MCPHCAIIILRWPTLSRTTWSDAGYAHSSITMRRIPRWASVALPPPAHTLSITLAGVHCFSSAGNGEKKNLTQLCAKKAVKSFFSFRYKSFLTFNFSFFWLLRHYCCDLRFQLEFFANFRSFSNFSLTSLIYSGFCFRHFARCIFFSSCSCTFIIICAFILVSLFFFVFRYFVFAYVIAEVQWDKCQKRVNARRENASDTFTARGGSRNSKILMIHSMKL